jgi:Zn-dependent protease
MTGPVRDEWGAPAPVPAPSPPSRDYEPIHPGSGRESWRERLKRLGGPIVAGLILVATKLKAVLLLLPKLKLLTTSATMLVSIAAYALIWSWSFAIGFVVLLLLHELGHVFQLRREGIKASAPMFIPFLGAVVTAKSMGDDAAAEARVGLAGPVLGTLATLVPLGLWLTTGNEYWQALAYVGFFINLFNLLPVLPLDGGRAMAALSPWVWLAGYAGLIALTIAFFNPILLLIVVFGGFELYSRWKARKTPEARAYHAVPARTRAIVAAVYLGLVIALAIGVDQTFLHKTLSDV